MERQRNPLIDLPLKITLTPQGVEWFVRRGRKLSQLRMADRRLEYGITVSGFPASALQRMINIDYITAIELASTEFSSKRHEIIDLTKLIVFRILYRKFEHETYRVFLNSPLIKRWNRTNPTRVIDESTVFNQSSLQAFLSGVAAHIPAISRELQQPFINSVRAETSLSQEEQRQRFYLSDAFVISMRKIIWYVLVRFRGQPEYAQLVSDFQRLLAQHVGKALIAEYLALMIVELMGFSEISHYRQVASVLSGNPKAAEAVASNERLRAAVQKQMGEEGDLLYLTFQLASPGASIGTEDRLRVTVCNREREYNLVREELEQKPAADIRQKSLADFYKQIPAEHVDTELGRYYLSYLQDTCEKQNVRIESSVSQPAHSDLIVMQLVLQF